MGEELLGDGWRHRRPGAIEVTERLVPQPHQLALDVAVGPGPVRVREDVDRLERPSVGLDRRRGVQPRSCPHAP